MSLSEPYTFDVPDLHRYGMSRLLQIMPAFQLVLCLMTACRYHHAFAITYCLWIMDFPVQTLGSMLCAISDAFPLYFVDFS